MAQSLGISPGEVIDRAHMGDVEVEFCLAAAVEQHHRDGKRWRELFRALGQIAKALSRR